jgi:putative membrane protein
MQYGMMDGYGMSYGSYGIMGIIGLIFWILVIAGLVLLIKYLWEGGAAPRVGQESALDILKKRYASGEISKEEFENKKKDLL